MVSNCVAYKKMINNAGSPCLIDPWVQPCHSSSMIIIMIFIMYVSAANDVNTSVDKDKVSAVIYS